MEASKGGHNESSVIIASQRLFGSQFLQQDTESALQVLNELADEGRPSAQRVSVVVIVCVNYSLVLKVVLFVILVNVA